MLIEKTNSNNNKKRRFGLGNRQSEVPQQAVYEKFNRCMQNSAVVCKIRQFYAKFGRFVQNSAVVCKFQPLYARFGLGMKNSAVV